MRPHWQRRPNSPEHADDLALKARGLSHTSASLNRPRSPDPAQTHAGSLHAQHSPMTSTLQANSPQVMRLSPPGGGPTKCRRRVKTLGHLRRLKVGPPDRPVVRVAWARLRKALRRCLDPTGRAHRTVLCGSRPHRNRGARLTRSASPDRPAHDNLLTSMDGENQRANDNDRYVLAAQPGKSQRRPKRKPALEAHRPNRPARLRSPRGPCPGHPTVRSEPGSKPEHDFHAPRCERHRRSSARLRDAQRASVPSPGSPVAGSS